MLQTTRLHLRNLRPTDADTMFDYRNDSRCSRYQRYEDTGKAYLQKFVQDFFDSTFPSAAPEQHYAIAQNTDGVMIGDLSVFFTQKDNCFTLGITIAPAFQKQGYAYELLHTVTSRLCAQYPTVDLVALIEKENVGSIALFQKLGFAEECYAASIASYVYTLPGNAALLPESAVQ